MRQLKPVIVLYFIVALSLVMAWTNIDGHNDSNKPDIIKDGHKQTLAEINPQVILPQYKTADVLLEDLGASIVELLPPDISPTDLFGAFSILDEGGTYYLWLNTSMHGGGSSRPSVEQRFESQDGLVWQNRTDTNLIKNESYKFVAGLRGIAKNGNSYEGWEQYYYEWSSGWGFAIRYATSNDGVIWTVVNEPALIGAYYVSVIPDGATYRMWVHPNGDSNYAGTRSLRYRTSNDPGTGWGHWQTGGTEVNLDGAGNNLRRLTRVRQATGGTYELFYIDPIYEQQDILRLNKATSTDGLNFTTVITNMIDFNEVMPTIWNDRFLTDFAVVDVGGEDWVYFTYCEQNVSGCTDSNIAVSRPVYAEIEVLDGVVNIPDDSGIVNFGTTLVGAPITKVFTVHNSGEGDLTLTPPITLPVGYSLVNSFGTTTVTSTSSITFEVQLDATTMGAVSGILAFDNNDLDENPYNFILNGTVNGNVYLPTIFKNYAVGSDLVVANVTVDSNGVIVVIKNAALNVAVNSTFRVDLYVDPNPVPTMVNQPWTQLSTEGVVWNVTEAIPPGGQLALTINDPHYVGALSNYSGSPPAGTPIYVQVDTFGNVLEVHEVSGGVYNNIKGAVAGP